MWIKYGDYDLFLNKYYVTGCKIPYRYIKQADSYSFK